MAVLGWAQLSAARCARKTLALARIEYVRAAIAVGAGDGRIIFRHILPNVLSHVIVAVTLAIPTVVLLESLPRLPRLRGEAAADLLGPDAAGYRHLLGDRLLSLDPVARRLRARSPSSRSTRSATACATPSIPIERPAHDRRSRQTFAPAERYDLGAHGRELILDARNIARRLQGRGRHRPGRARRLVPAPQGRDHRPRRRKRLRQIGDRAHGHGAADQARHDRQAGAASRSTARTSLAIQRRREMRKLRGNDISMIFQEPMSSLNPVYTDRPADLRGPAPAQQDEPQAEAMERARDAARRSADPRAGGAAAPVSAPALRRPAPARHDRHGARQPARHADRRRADHGARRHRAGADPQPDQGPAGPLRHGGDPDHPRPDHRPAVLATTSM